ncbi:NAD(P)/FAD-dependent oxidoreductase [Nakamurella sp. PAMC28650]|uniref:FAD/NAD(P)-dependent oxidoreductase n=1 Tax=Nakamurella sp. PAMC28650 TaxID=2762325 RepID=UPI00164D6287|nr:NAD(P)/FAD-dependent oxidoreductase [Nakamurella sp. PAMC28650]QNK81883.1 FAD-dependent oxidoreductase [Nakamurella sp. PAMC28650]
MPISSPEFSSGPRKSGPEVVFDIAVLGAGPAGLAAAGAAAAAGARVALIDAGRRIGGQYWRHLAEDDGRHHTGWPIFAGLRRRIDQQPERIENLAGHSVWQVETLLDNGFRVNTTTDDGQHSILARTVILAPGAYDRQLPFPGWTLPGVFTAGGTQALLKGHGVVAGSRIAVAGTGPFLLAVAAGLAGAGAEVVGVFEAGGAPTAFARHPIAVAQNLGKLGEGAHYARVLARHHIPYRTRTAVIAARGVSSVSGVTVAKLDRGWKVVEGSQREIDCDTLAVGYGFTPQLELAVQLGCATRLDVDGSLVAVVDGDQRSSAEGVWVAGEATGVGGAALSVTEGEIAGRNAAHAAVGVRPDLPVMRRLVRRRASQQRFAAALLQAYPIRPGWMTWSAQDTIVCRCEEVTLGTIDEAVVELGAADPRAVKLYARPGMGLCQGRVCGYATGCLVADRAGRTPNLADLQGVAGRPIAAPITLGQLAEAHHRNTF